MQDLRITIQEAKYILRNAIKIQGYFGKEYHLKEFKGVLEN